jgi:hypothetical protein
VIRLAGGVVEGSEYILAFQESVVGEDLIDRGTRSEEFEDIRDPDPKAPNTGASTALAFFD